MEWSGRDLGIHSQGTPVSEPSLTGRSSLLRGQNEKPRQTRRAPGPAGFLRDAHLWRLPRDGTGREGRDHPDSSAAPHPQMSLRAAPAPLPRPRSPGSGGGSWGRLRALLEQPMAGRAGSAAAPDGRVGSGRVGSGRVGSGPVGSERGWRGRRAAPTYGAGGGPGDGALNPPPPLSQAVPAPGRISALCPGATSVSGSRREGTAGRCAPEFNPGGVH